MSEPYYQDDSVRLYRGDALRTLVDLADSSIDAVVADPPYSSGGMVRSDRTGSTVNKYVLSRNTQRNSLTDFSGDNRDQRSYAYWCALWLGECARVTKPGGVCLLFTDWRQLPATTDALQAGGWVWRGVVPWYKPNARPQAGRFSSNCEYVVWGSNGGMTTDLTAPCLPGFYQASPPREREHITQKPVEVMRELVKIAPLGGAILDPFMGSGTTGVASVLEGRKFVGVEQVAHYAEVARDRIQLSKCQAVDKGSQASLDFSQEGAGA
jgi:site-specific DNA-methyltransferase (adenine-specific)